MLMSHNPVQTLWPAAESWPQLVTREAAVLLLFPQPHGSCPFPELRGFLALVSRHRQQADGALVISRVSATDAGFFTCTASNGRDQDQHRVQLRPIGTERRENVIL